MNDDKRWICADGVYALAHGHYLTEKHYNKIYKMKSTNVYFLSHKKGGWWGIQIQSIAMFLHPLDKPYFTPFILKLILLTYFKSYFYYV